MSEDSDKRAYRAQLFEDRQLVIDWLEEWSGEVRDWLSEILEEFEADLPDWRKENATVAFNSVDQAVNDLLDLLRGLGDYVDESEFDFDEEEEED